MTVLSITMTPITVVAFASALRNDITVKAMSSRLNRFR